MKSEKKLVNHQQKPVISLENQQAESAKIELEEKITLGQRLADKLAAKVGSWAFLISQTGILTAWVGLNMAPGVPHWDEQPFILLNLVFSFASAYTAPIVLMSQNRQSDVDRKKNEYDHMVNRKAGQDIELLHEKIDQLQSQHIQQLTKIIFEQQKSINEMKNSVIPLIQQSQVNSHPMKVGVLPTMEQQSSLNSFQVTDANGKQYSVYLPFQLDQQTINKTQVINKQQG
ncbi:MAG: DUF1003 domain-containing protein [Fischerella sp. CENA71]|nr:DUF1003 domain-containing protein [Fischerella sp. CENA71]